MSDACPSFAVGDRVRLKVTTAPNWIDPKIANRAKLGRVATVTVVLGTALPDKQKSYRINFDCVGRERPFSEVFDVRDLEAAP